MSSTRVQRRGEKTVVFVGGGQDSAPAVTVSCGGQCSTRGSVYRVPNASETGGGYLPAGCRTTVSLENMASSSEPKIVRVVPRGTTILLEEVKPAAAKSGRSKSRAGSPTVQVVDECGYAAPRPRPEPGPAEHCIECLAELVQRRRTERRLDQGASKSRRLVSGTDGGPTAGACPACGRPFTGPRRR